MPVGCRHCRWEGMSQVLGACHTMHCCNTVHGMVGVSKNMDSYEIRQPLGVAAGICPFNFPGECHPCEICVALITCHALYAYTLACAVMCPLWMLPIAIGTGNTFLLKPSEKVKQ